MKEILSLPADPQALGSGTLPCTGVKTEPPVAMPAPSSVLVVDDEALVGSMLEVIMKLLGCGVHVARTGKDAIEQLRADDSIALVLLDVRMPDLDGPATLEQMRRLKPDIHCCFMSGDTGKYTEKELLGQGVLGILRKPFHLAEIVHILNKAGIAVDGSATAAADA